ncbi:MAG: hypothetical protein KGO49_06685 [Gammaproteobacteria bacterium]|nr:hypothetical protein [Gammaproteobacteria bacterium]
MAKHLTDRDIEHIVKLLDGWQDKLTWDVLCEACAPVIGTHPVRQTLMKITRVKDAFDACKKRLSGEMAEIAPLPSMKIAIERISRLERENERLKRENNKLLEQFAVWQYNAHNKRLNNHDLNKALPTIDRGQTADFD